MKTPFPGPRTLATLERGIPLFRNGAKFHEELARSGRRGFRTANQIVVDKAEGDFIWDMDGKSYIDFQNGHRAIRSETFRLSTLSLARP